MEVMLPSSLEMAMLALARIILFLAVSTVMCFGVRIRIIFITADQCSHRGFSVPHPTNETGQGAHRVGMGHSQGG